MQPALVRIWLNLKQHRFEVYAVVIVAIVVTIGDLVEAMRLNSISAPAECNPQLRWNMSFGGGVTDDPCQVAARMFAPIANSMDVLGLTVVGMLFPFVAALALGIPIVAREVEQGTAPQAFALAGSRSRWLAWKAGSMLLVLIATLIPVAIATNVLYVAGNRGLDAQSAFGDYEFRGAMVIGWGIAGFAGAVALSTLVRRTLPSVIIGLVACLLAIGLGAGGMRHFVFTPMAQPSSDPSIPTMNLGEMSRDTRPEQFVYARQYLHGREISDQEANDWYLANQQRVVMTGPDGQAVGPDGKAMPEIKPEDMPYWVAFVVPGSKYPTVVAIELMVLLGGAIVFAGLALYAVNRRRPY